MEWGTSPEHLIIPPAVEECYGDVIKKLPNVIAGHIDYESIARDMELGGDVFTIDKYQGGGILVFSAC